MGLPAFSQLFHILPGGPRWLEEMYYVVRSIIMVLSFSSCCTDMSIGV